MLARKPDREDSRELRHANRIPVRKNRRGSIPRGKYVFRGGRRATIPHEINFWATQPAGHCCGRIGSRARDRYAIPWVFSRRPAGRQVARGLSPRYSGASLALFFFFFFFRGPADTLESCCTSVASPTHARVAHANPRLASASLSAEKRRGIVVTRGGAPVFVPPRIGADNVGRRSRRRHSALDASSFKSHAPHGWEFTTEISDSWSRFRTPLRILIKRRE